MTKIKKTTHKRAKGFRIEATLEKRLQTVSGKLGLPESWFISNALTRLMPEYEKMAKTQTAAKAA